MERLKTTFVLCIIKIWRILASSIHNCMGCKNHEISCFYNINSEKSKQMSNQMVDILDFRRCFLDVFLLFYTAPHIWKARQSMPSLNSSICANYFSNNRQLNIVLELSIWFEEKNSKQKAEFDMNTVWVILLSPSYYVGQLALSVVHIYNYMGIFWCSALTNYKVQLIVEL
jgi:hypothetical protein